MAPPTINLDNPDVEARLDLAPNEKREREDRHRLVELLRLRRHQRLARPGEGRRLMWRHIAANALTVFIVALIALAGLIGWGQSQYSGEGPLAEPICLEVRPNMRMARLGDELADRGAVRNARVFRLGAEYSGKADDLKAGSFLVPAGASMEEIVDIVTRGRAEHLRDRSGLPDRGDPPGGGGGGGCRPPPNRAGSPCERPSGTPGGGGGGGGGGRAAVPHAPRPRGRRGGAPTRRWGEAPDRGAANGGGRGPADAPAPRLGAPWADGRGAALLAEMAQLQATRLAEAWANRDENLPIETPEEALILASIIEKETGVADERGTVASVFVNRLNLGMRLQTDPTVIYGVTEGRGVLGRGLRQSELRARTPWNTYVIDGLPPTPIANPGLASIVAALNPEETDLVYFVADGSGGHAFARTLEEHNANVARWREIEAQPGKSMIC